MPWTPGIAGALSRLGSVACQYDQELGIRILEKGYSVAAGLDLDLGKESSIHVPSELAAEASKCQPEFGFRSPIDRLINNVWGEFALVRLEVLVGNDAARMLWKSVGFEDYCVTMESRIHRDSAKGQERR